MLSCPDDRQTGNKNQGGTEHSDAQNTTHFDC